MTLPQCSTPMLAYIQPGSGRLPEYDLPPPAACKIALHVATMTVPLIGSRKWSAIHEEQITASTEIVAQSQKAALSVIMRHNASRLTERQSTAGEESASFISLALNFVAATAAAGSELLHADHQAAFPSALRRKISARPATTLRADERRLNNEIEQPFLNWLHQGTGN